MNLPGISIIIPLYNEEKYILNLLKSITNQEYNYKKVEIILVDGNSKDDTKNIITKFKKNNKKIDIKLFTNPKRRIPMAFNIGIKKSMNDIIFILGAHSEYPKDYFKKCVTTLLTSQAHNVGGILQTVTKNKTLIGTTIKYITSSFFGVGNSKFRTTRRSGEVDTVLFFCFYKNITEKIGLFDERIFRNQDNEFNYRMKKNGFKLWQNPDIIIKYYNVDSFKKLFFQAFTTGKWNLWTVFIHPFCLKLRHFIPFGFVLYFSISLILFLLNFFPGFILLMIDGGR